MCTSKGVYMRILIIGGGKATEELLKRLDLRKNQVTIVEKNPERRQEIMSNFDVVVIGKDASDPSLYTSDIKINEFDAIIALTDSDEVNMLSLAIARMHESKSQFRIANASDRKIADLIRHLQIGVPIIQPSVVASMIINYLFTIKNPLELARFKIGETDYYIYYVTIAESDKANGRKVSEIEKEPETGLLKILMIFDGEFFRPPSPDDDIKAGYQLVILSSLENINEYIKG